MIGRLLIASALLAGSLRVAHAGSSSCGGGSSSSSSSSSSGSSGGGGSSDGSSSSTSATPACVEAADIHGYRTCPGARFGTWGGNLRFPHLFAEVGLGVRGFADPLGSRDGTLTHEADLFTYRVSSAPSQPGAAARAHAMVTTLRVGGVLAHGLYLAADAELGGLVRASSRVEMTSAGERGTPTITPASTMVASALAVAGIARSVGPLQLGVELAGGASSVSYTYRSTYLACETLTSQTAVRGLAEAHARAALYVAPFVAVTANVGTSLVERDAWSAGLGLAFSTRAYGRH